MTEDFLILRPGYEDPNPTEAWKEGWTAAMEGDLENPYYIHTPEHDQWEDGWWAAMED